MATGTIKSVIPRSDIVDNLTTNDSTKVLSAAQGKALSEQIGTLQSGKLNAYRHNITGHSSITTTDITDFLTAYTNYGAVAVDFYRTDNQNIVGSMFYCRTNVNYGAGILVSYYDDGLKQVLCSGGTVTIKKVTVAT